MLHSQTIVVAPPPVDDTMTLHAGGKPSVAHHWRVIAFRDISRGRTLIHRNYFDGCKYIGAIPQLLKPERLAYPMPVCNTGREGSRMKGPKGRYSVVARQVAIVILQRKWHSRKSKVTSLRFTPGEVRQTMLGLAPDTSSGRLVLLDQPLLHHE